MQLRLCLHDDILDPGQLLKSVFTQHQPRPILTDFHYTTTFRTLGRSLNQNLLITGLAPSEPDFHYTTTVRTLGRSLNLNLLDTGLAPS